jgi:hypothetical protein
VHLTEVPAKGRRDLEGRGSGIHCEMGMGDEVEVEGVRWLMEGDDYKSYTDEELIDRVGKLTKLKLKKKRKHTMKLVLYDVVRIWKWLGLSRDRIPGVKELIYSILHDWSGKVPCLMMSRVKI